MKNATLLIEPDDIMNYVMQLWTPDGPFAESQKAGGFIYDIVRRFAEVPRIFFDASDKDLEWTHFSTWWGAIMRVDYDNPYIRDLRYLHEIYHGATMPYVQGMDFETFKHRNFMNEKQASAFTEMAIYLEFPELREKTFSHPIFVDRFVFPNGTGADDADWDWSRRWVMNPSRTLEELMLLRMADESLKDDDDPQVIWLQRYREQNERWANIWRQRHNDIDEAMLKLRARSAAGQREAAGEAHMDWLASVSENDIPFYREARQFRAAFDELLEEYEAAMKKHGHEML